MEAAGRSHELAKPRPARAAAGGEGAGLEPREAQPRSDSSRGSRACTAGDAQCAPRPPPPGPVLPGAALSVPPAPERESWGRRPGPAAGRQQPLPPQPPWPGLLPRPRPHTDFLESTRPGLPDWRPLGPPTPSRTRRECVPLGSQHPPVRLSLPPRELPDPPSQQLPQLDRAVCAAGSPSAKQAPAHSLVAGYPGSCSSREEGAAQRSPCSLQSVGHWEAAVDTNRDLLRPGSTLSNRGNI